MRRKDKTFSGLIITGEARSGTTLVANFLNSQGECVVYSDLFKDWFVEYRKLGLDSILSPLTDLQKNVLFTNLVAEGWKFGVSSFDEIERNTFSTPLDLIKHAYEKLDPSKNARIIGTKITRHYPYLDELLNNGFKIIFCIRDPRDVLLSAKNRFSDYNMFHRTIFYKESVERMRVFEGKKDFYTLKFENLLSAETRYHEISKLANFLQVDINPDPEEIFIRDGIKFVSNSSFGDVNNIFDERALYRWKRDTSSMEVIFASKFLSKQIEYLNYPIFEVSLAKYWRLFLKYIFNLVKYWLKIQVQKLYFWLVK